MSPTPTFTSRRLNRAGVAAADALAAAAGVPGVYIRNVLSAHPRLGSHADILCFESRGFAARGFPARGDGEPELLGLAYFGPRGNLLVLQRTPLAAAAVADAVLAHGSPWRIVLAPADLVEEIVRCGRVATIVDRQQVYYVVEPADLVLDLAATDVRLAEKKDLDALMQAALHLNQTDLHVDPVSVDRDWLKRSTKHRMRQRLTYVIGPLGDPIAKLDLGSVGPAGVVVEGVYTWPAHRGRGLAPALLTAVAAECFERYPLVCLHVAADNTAARRAYEKCGMYEAGTCQLMLRR